MKRVENRANVETADGEIHTAGIKFNVPREEKKGKEKMTVREQRVRGQVKSRQQGDAVYVRCKYWRAFHFISFQISNKGPLICC